ncbi:MAG TPA: helix-turn-helix domain-containing protein [Candidatus Salinicoccus merdavium]|nr:helix-turn-helix domain-containing protein [Candidatus Salinicoccus merdavium]
MKLGAYLRDKREKAGVTLKEMQEKSGIRKSIIRTIETGDFSKLPEPNHVYFLIEKYAKVMGLDADYLFSRFSDDLPEENEQSKKRQQSENEDFKYLRKVLISFGAMIGILFVLWLILLQVGSETDMFESTPIYESTAFDIESYAEEDDTSYSGEEEEETEEQAEEKESSEEESESESTADISYVGMDNNTLFYDVSVNGDFEVTLSGANSWVSLSDDAGNTYAYEELSEGEFSIDENASALYLTIGNAPEQELTVGGESVSSSESTDAITVHYEFNIVRE